MTFSSLLKKYKNGRGSAVAFSEHAARCPICRYPLHQGSQLSCEPGVCLYREIPERYDAKRIGF